MGHPRPVIDGRRQAVGRESARVGRDEGVGTEEGTGDFVVSWDEFGETIACRVVADARIHRSDPTLGYKYANHSLAPSLVLR